MLEIIIIIYVISDCEWWWWQRLQRRWWWWQWRQQWQQWQQRVNDIDIKLRWVWVQFVIYHFGLCQIFLSLEVYESECRHSSRQQISNLAQFDRLQFDRQKRAKFSKTSNSQILLSSSSICAWLSKKKTLKIKNRTMPMTPFICLSACLSVSCLSALPMPSQTWNLSSQMDKWKSPCVLQDFVPFVAAAKKG